MNQSEAREMWPIIKAWSEGNTLEVAGEPVKSHRSIIFDGAPSIYTIKPEPKLRPWKSEEVPVGALYKQRNNAHRGLIVGIVGNNVQLGNGSGYDLERDLLRDYQHSLDHGKTWLPCGVEE
jgi:hypothetical protein